MFGFLKKITTRLSPANSRLLKGRFSVIEVKSDRCDRGWSCIRITGALDLALTGILAELSDSLAKAGIPIFAISTYNTDYILVKTDKLKNAIAALKGSGYLFIT